MTIKITTIREINAEDYDDYIECLHDAGINVNGDILMREGVYTTSVQCGSEIVSSTYMIMPEGLGKNDNVKGGNVKVRRKQ